jgi:hypothetical protein
MNPRNVAGLLQSVRVNGFANVLVLPLAAPDREEIVRYASLGSNSGIKRANHIESEGYQFARAARLDDVLGNVKRLKLAKIDVVLRLCNRPNTPSEISCSRIPTAS